MSNRFSWSNIGSYSKPLLIFPPIIVAVIVFVVLTNGRSDPEEHDDSELVRALSVIEVQSYDFRPEIEAFGTSRYVRTWRAVAQVSGKIEIDPKLNSGALFENGALLFSIDDKDYQDAYDQLEASIEQVDANIAQLIQTEANYDKTIENEKEVLAVYKKELDRAVKLVEDDAGAISAIDAKERAYLAQKQKIQDIQNQKDLIKPQKDAYQATKTQSQKQLSQANRDLERTKVYAPFLMRIGDVDLDDRQFVTTNEVLFEGYSYEEVEIEAQLSGADIPLLMDRTAIPEGVDVENIDPALLRKIFPVTALVRNDAGGPKRIWKARLERFRESFDSQSKTIKMVVRVQNPKRFNLVDEERPLISGAFCKVSFYGPDHKNKIVIPLYAVRDNKVQVLNSENRVEVKDVEVEFEIGEYAVISKGLSVGQKIVVSDPRPLIPGMLVNPIFDKAISEELKSKMEQTMKIGPPLQ